MKLKIFYPVINGEITGGNIIALRIIDEALRKGYGVVVNSPAEGKFTRLLEEKGIKVYHIDTCKTFRLDSVFRLACIIKKEGISLIHSHTPLSGTVLSRLGGFIAGVPVITHAHVRDSFNRNPFIGFYQFLLNWFTSRFFCFKIIAVSQAIKKEIICQGVIAGKIDVIYNGINLSSSSQNINSGIGIRDEFGIRQNQKIIAQVGRLCEDKGQHVLIKAAKIVIKEYDCVFLIVGEDLGRAEEYKNSLQELVHGCGLGQRVIFTGYRSDVPGLMNTFDIFTLPSFVEGLPVVILEAMAAKKPVITTPVGGNTEIVIDGQTGTIVPQGSPDKLAEALMYHLKNQEISKKMGEAGYEMVKAHFPLSVMLDKIMAVYSEAVKDNR